VSDLPGAALQPTEPAGVLAEMPGGAEPRSAKQALDEKHEQLAQLLRLALRMVEEQ
jgi:hypothetical protein